MKCLPNEFFEFELTSSCNQIRRSRPVEWINCSGDGDVVLGKRLKVTQVGEVISSDAVDRNLMTFRTDDRKGSRTQSSDVTVLDLVFVRLKFKHEK